jgi:cysteine-rich repeat protein
MTGAALPGSAHAWQWALERTISSPSPTSGQGNNLGFGSAMASMGNTLLVGNPVATGGPLALGAGYVVDPSTGAVLQTFYSPNATTCFFGTTVAAAGGAAWVGSFTGEAFGCRPQHFLFDPTNGTLLNTINDPLPQPNDQTFGESVASAGGTRVLTGDQYDLGIQGVGYLIDLGSPGGALVHAFPNPVPSTVYFGERVAAAGNALAIAAPARHVSLYDATTFLRLWTKLQPSPSEIYGEYLAADATHLAVGSPSVQAPPGHAYLYDHAGALVTTMTDPVLGSTNFFGEAVVLSSSQVIVSDPDEASGAPVAGAVYVFDRATGNLLQTIPNPTPQDHDFFGNKMVAVGSLLAVGADHAGPSGQRGIVYIYAPCGDGTLDPGQECDDGNNDPGDSCDPNCRAPGCGNGYLDTAAGEVCDDGNLQGGDGCRADCTPEACGDGILDPGEACDDGNTDPGDGCDPNCQLPGCGNGYRDVAAGETCDDGNLVAGDCCSPTCQLASAGTPCGAGGGQCTAGGTCVGIPTLGEWGVLLGSLLMMAAVVLRHRRRVA